MKFTANIDSSCVMSAVYDSDASVLSLEFPSGKVYDYEKVPKSVFDELSNAKSAGSYFNSVIKPTYSVKK